MKRLVICLVLLCGELFGAEQLPLGDAVLIFSEQPNSNQQAPGFSGYAVGWVSSARHELCSEFSLSPYIGFPGGVWVERAWWNTATLCRPYSTFQVDECTTNVGPTTTWSNSGPYGKTGATLVVRAGQGGTGCSSVTVQSAGLATRLQTRIDAGQSMFRLVAHMSSSSANYARMDYQVITADIWLGGDADRDGDVDFADYQILANNFGLPGNWSQGDFTHDGFVDFADFVVLANNYGLSL